MNWLFSSQPIGSKMNANVSESGNYSATSFMFPLYSKPIPCSKTTFQSVSDPKSHQLHVKPVEYVYPNSSNTSFKHKQHGNHPTTQNQDRKVTPGKTLNGMPHLAEPVHLRLNPLKLAGNYVRSPSRLLKLHRLIQAAIYGGVYLATVESYNDGSPVTGSCTCTRQKVAIKAMSLELNKLNQDKLLENAYGELLFYNRMRGHRNVMVFEEAFQKADLLFVVLAYAEYEDLFEVLKKRKKPFSEHESRWIFWQLLHAAHFLHCKGICFQDHSLENILMFRSENDTIYPKITDPGQATIMTYNEAGKANYIRQDKVFGKSFRCPESYQSKPYDPIKVDSFSMGWMLYFCLTKHQLFEKAKERDANWRLILNKEYKKLLSLRCGNGLSDQAIDLVFKLVHPEFEKRYSIEQAISHPWFQLGSFNKLTSQTLYADDYKPEPLFSHCCCKKNEDLSKKSDVRYAKTSASTYNTASKIFKSSSSNSTESGTRFVGSVHSDHKKTSSNQSPDTVSEVGTAQISSVKQYETFENKQNTPDPSVLDVKFQHLAASNGIQTKNSISTLHVPVKSNQSTATSDSEKLCTLMQTKKGFILNGLSNAAEFKKSLSSSEIRNNGIKEENAFGSRASVVATARVHVAKSTVGQGCMNANIRRFFNFKRPMTTIKLDHNFAKNPLKGDMQLPDAPTHAQTKHYVRLGGVRNKFKQEKQKG